MTFFKHALMLSLLSLSAQSFATDTLIPGKPYFQAGSLSIGQEQEPTDDYYFEFLGIFTRTGIYSPTFPTEMEAVTEVYQDEHPFFQSLLSSSKTEIKENSVSTFNTTGFYETNDVSLLGVAHSEVGIKCVGKTPVISDSSFVDGVLSVEGTRFRASGALNEVINYSEDNRTYKITFNYQKKEINGRHGKIVHNAVMLEVDNPDYNQKYTRVIGHSKAEAFCK